MKRKKKYTLHGNKYCTEIKRTIWKVAQSNPTDEIQPRTYEEHPKTHSSTTRNERRDTGTNDPFHSMLLWQETRHESPADTHTYSALTQRQHVLQMLYGRHYEYQCRMRHPESALNIYLLPRKIINYKANGYSDVSLAYQVTSSMLRLMLFQVMLKIFTIHTYPVSDRHSWCAYAYIKYLSIYACTQ